MFKDGSWKSVQESGELKYAVLDAEEVRMEYPEEFGRRMEQAVMVVSALTSSIIKRME